MTVESYVWELRLSAEAQSLNVGAHRSASSLVTKVDTVHGVCFAERKFLTLTRLAGSPPRPSSES
jgi:hypothetical protein